MSEPHNNHEPHKLMAHTNGRSLEEINGSVEVPVGKDFGEHYSPIQDLER